METLQDYIRRQKTSKPEVIQLAFDSRSERTTIINQPQIMSTSPKKTTTLNHREKEELPLQQVMKKKSTWTEHKPKPDLLNDL